MNFTLSSILIPKSTNVSYIRRIKSNNKYQRLGKATAVIPFVVGLLLFSLISISGYSQSAYELTREMFATTKQFETIKFTIKKSERIDGEMKIQISDVKLKYGKLLLEYQRDHVKQLITSIENNNVAIDSSDTGTSVILTNSFSYIFARLIKLG